MGLFKDTSLFLRELLSLGFAEEDLDLVVRVYNEAGLLGKDKWSNVPLHCLLVAMVARELAKEARIEKRRSVLLASLFHDVLKAKERSRAKDLQAMGMPEDRSFTQAAEEQANWLQGIGVPAEVVVMSRFSGHTSLVHFLRREAYSVEEAIFHVADDLCGGKEGDEVMLVEGRIKALKERYPFLVTEGADQLEGVTFIVAQETIAKRILEDIAQCANMPSGETLNRELVRRFKDWKK